MDRVAPPEAFPDRAKNNMNSRLGPADNLDNLISLSLDLNGIGPYRLARFLRLFATQVGARSLSYNLGMRPTGDGTSPSYHFYASRRSLVRRANRDYLGDAPHKWISDVLRRGQPIAFNDQIERFKITDADLYHSAKTLKELFHFKDAYLVPVFGPHRVNAVVVFGFDQDIKSVDQPILESASSILPTLHNKFVQIFYRKSEIENSLSDRERQVLTWIARGKSSFEVAQILHISTASVDTYTRRIFKKLEVNDRVSAAILGVENGLVTP